MKTAVFGSAFNPPHIGHKDVVDQLLNTFDLVLLVPAYAHAFGKSMAPYRHRCAMLEGFVKEYFPNNPKVIINRIEEHIAFDKPKNSPIYTWDVLNALSQYHPDYDLCFVIGPDNRKAWNRFYRAEDISNTFKLFHAEERLPVRSTDCRLLTNTCLASSVGSNVADYIKQNSLYAYAPQSS